MSNPFAKDRSHCPALYQPIVAHCTEESVMSPGTAGGSAPEAPSTDDLVRPQTSTGHPTEGSVSQNRRERTVWSFNSAQEVLFGVGAIARIPTLLRRFNASRVALLSDPGVARAGVLASVEKVMLDAGITLFVYAEAMPEPDMASVLRCEAAVRAAQPDLLIAVGGGSSMDLAKIIALLLTHGGHPSDYYGENQVPGPVMPVIAIPTTAGTGSEVSPVAIVTDDKLNIKVGISDNRLRPAVALLDPQLTLGLPPYITACTGMDALTQAIEAYYGKDFRYIDAPGDLIYQGSNPLSDYFAEKAIGMIAEHLPIGMHQGGNLEARSQLLLGNLYSALAFTNSGVSWVHAVAYPLAELAPRPHGELVGLLLPYGMRYNMVVHRDKLARIGELLGAPASLSRDAKCEAGVQRIFQLLETLGLPSRLSQIGIEEAQLESIVDDSLNIERLNRINPRTPRRDDLLALLRSAL
ncbi:MAG: iron-containing alcohol dehydrogenase [Pseudomonas sp.]|uniref:iron-containing alcohol dehydrogenase family protein n=1 Tax=Pseudomonas sp. TaxID=306 RepID=UPI00299D23C9|nr:iron-containing alcohol dehydrogenase [Pseudomonas sp.]MDX1726121.1 iron-containing alcohol dehydrogenase [Pseudomonas sp.]